MKTIFVTGGHLIPALAVMRQMQKSGNWRIYYLGRKHSMEGENALSLEYQQLRDDPSIIFLNLNLGRIQPKFLVNVGQSLVALSKIPIGIFESLFYLLKYQPKIILTFGGFLAVPLAIWGWFLGIPVATHEQTMTTGRANKIISIFAKKIFLSWQANLADFPASKTVFTGNPLPAEIFRHQFSAHRNLKTIFITGGKTGSHVLNSVVYDDLDYLTSKYQLIHQIGESSFHDFERLRDKAGKLGLKLKNYQPIKFLSPNNFIDILEKSDLVISRSGANVITHLAYGGKVAILIPIPWSKEAEQLKNAKMLAQFGGAVIVPEEEFQPPRLNSLLDEMTDNFSCYQRAALKAKKLITRDAAVKIVSEIEKL